MRAIIISLKNKKSVVVRVERVFTHLKYGKTVKRHKNFQAAVSTPLKIENLSLGQVVEIKPSRPDSARKRFLLIKVYDSKKD